MMNSRPTKKPNAPRGPFKGLRDFMTKVMESKKFLMLLSVLMAVVTWSALVASDGTLTREKVFQNVAVNITGESTLKSRGYIVMDDIKALVPGVKMTVEVTQANYNRVSGTSYNPHFDLSKVEGVGENEIPIAFSSQLYGPVVECDPSCIVVNVERYMTRRVPVVIDLEGEIGEGMYLDTYRTDPTMLSVSGPQSLVTKVARASAKLDLSALSMDRASDRTSLLVELQAADGTPVVSDKLEVTNQMVITDSVIVDTELVPSRNIPLDLNSLVKGEPAVGFELAGIEMEEDALAVAARQEILDGIEFLVADQPLDISGAEADVSGFARIKRVTGIENTLPSEIAVTARIQEETIERTMRQVAIDVDALGAGLSAELSKDQVTVQLTGGYRFINGLEKTDVRLFVDAGGLAPGTYTLPVQIRIDNAEPFTCALSASEVVVTIKE